MQDETVFFNKMYDKIKPGTCELNRIERPNQTKNPQREVLKGKCNVFIVKGGGKIKCPYEMTLESNT